MPRSAPFLLTLSTLAIATGCSPESPTATGERASVSFVGLDPAEPWGDPAVFEPRTIEIPPADQVWGAIFNDSISVRTESDAAGEPRRELDVPPAGRPFFIEVPLDFDPSEFQTARVWIRSRGFSRMAVLIERATKFRARADWVESAGLTEMTPVDIDLARLRAVDRRQSSFHLVFEALTHPARIGKIELIRESPQALLPDPGEGATELAHDSDFRSGYVALAGSPLTGALVCPGRPHRLEVDAAASTYGLVSDMRTVDVEVLDGDAVVLSRELEVAWTSGWKTLALDLEGEAAEAIRAGRAGIRLSTSSADGVFVSEPRIHHEDPSADAGSDPPPLVVLITSDTHRGDSVGYVGGPRTPFLDALSEQGVRFTGAASVTSITNPSHASLLTGLQPRDTAIYGNLVRLSSSAQTLAEAFRAEGFRTFAAVSARHLTPSRSGLGQGFERFDGPWDAITRDGKETLAAASEMLEASEGQPTFLWLHLFDVHAPYRPHDELVELYYQGDPYRLDLPELPPEVQAGWDKRIRDAAYIRAMYDTEVTYLDRILGTFFEENERLDSALLAFTADHGESLGDQGNYWTHDPLYPSTLGVPLFFKGPGVSAGATKDERVSNHHIARTLLEVAGLDGAADFPGESLLDERSTARLDAEPRFFVGANALSAAIELHPWYLLVQLEPVAWAQTQVGPRHRIELYNREEDPSCRTEVAADHPEEVAELHGALVAYLGKGPEGGGLAGGAPGGSAAADIDALGYTAAAKSTSEDALIDPNCDCPQCTAVREGR